MYTDYYRLTGFPFQVTPDSRFFFDSRPHRKAMAYLSYGLSKGEGFIVITGEIGAGKTTLIDYLISTLEGRNIVIARVVTSQVQAADLIRVVAQGFGIRSDRTNKATLLSQIEAFLVANANAGNRAFLVIDEAQSLASSSLEELRMLSNFGIGQQPLVQICLVGQPEFRTTLASARLEQLRQRIIASHHLVALDQDETQAYVEHRLRHVGWQGDPAFAADIFPAMHKETGGIPRRINIVCDRLLLLGFLEEKHQVGLADLEEVVRDLHGEEQRNAAIRAGGNGAAMGSPASESRDKVIAPRANGGRIAESDVESLHVRLANIERLLIAILANTSPRGDCASTLEALSGNESDREALLSRLRALEARLGGMSD